MRCTIHWQSSVSNTITVEAMIRLNYIVMIFAMNALMCVLAEEELYSDRYNNVDIRAVLEDENLRNEYYECFMEKAPCKTPEQKAMTEMFSEAYQTHCKKCTEKQKEILEIASDWYMKNEPDKWQLIVAKTTENMKKKNGGQ